MAPEFQWKNVNHTGPTCCTGGPGLHPMMDSCDSSLIRAASFFFSPNQGELSQQRQSRGDYFILQPMMG